MGLSGSAEVTGRGDQRETTRQDVEIVIARWVSTPLPTSSDLDGDGEIGEEQLPRPRR